MTILMTKTKAAKAAAREKKIQGVIDHFAGLSIQDTLEAYQHVLSVIYPDEIPPGTITQCRLVFSKTYVNVYDFVRASKNKQPVPRFKTYRDFVLDIQRTGRFFPLKKAKKDVCLNVLLKKIF